MTVSSYNILSHAYLNSRPRLCNGGILAQILSKISSTDTTVTIDSSLSIGGYIKQFFFNHFSNRLSFQNTTISFSNVNSGNLTTSVFGIIYLLFVLMTGLVLALLWICARMNRYHPVFQKLSQRHNDSKIKISHFVTFCPIKFRRGASNQRGDFQFTSAIEEKKKKKAFFNSVAFYCILCYILLLPMTICFIFSALSQGYLQQQIMDESKNTSLLSSWYQSLNHLDAFLDDIIYQSYKTLNLSLKNMSTSIEALLLGSLDSLTSQLLVNFGVYDIFANATMLIENLKETAQSMTYIKDNSVTIAKQINIETGNLRANVEHLLFYMPRVCDLLFVKTDCAQRLEDLKHFRVAINTSIISDHSSINMFFLLDQFQLNLTSLALNIGSMNATIINDIKAQTKDQVHKLNIDGSIQGILALWPQIQNVISPWKDRIKTTNSSVSSSLKRYGPIFFNITVLLLLFVALLSVLLILALTRFSLIYFLLRSILTDRIKSPESRPTSVVDHHKKTLLISKLQRSYKIRNSAIYIFIVLSCLVILVMAVLSLVVLNVGHLLFNEACTQIWSEDGLLVTDNILDVFLKVHWKNFISMIMPKELPIPINIPQPRAVLGGIRNNCSNNHGILYALQMTDFVNISAFVWSPENYKSLNDGLNFTYKTIVATDTKKLIPQDMVSFINTGSKIGKYFDEINYQPTIDELSKDVIELKDYDAWMISTIRYFLIFNDSNSKEIIRILGVITARRPDLQKLEQDVFTLKSNFKVIQERRINSLYIQGLISSISRVQSSLGESPGTYEMVHKVYSQIMLKEFITAVDESLNYQLANLFKNLFPCSNLSLAVSGLLGNFCINDFTLETICGYGLNLVLTSSFFIASLHILWIVIRKDFRDRDQKNISRC